MWNILFLFISWYHHCQPTTSLTFSLSLPSLVDMHNFSLWFSYMLASFNNQPCFLFFFCSSLSASILGLKVWYYSLFLFHLLLYMHTLSYKLPLSFLADYDLLLYYYCLLLVPVPYLCMLLPLPWSSFVGQFLALISIYLNIMLTTQACFYVCLNHPQWFAAFASTVNQIKTWHREKVRLGCVFFVYAKKSIRFDRSAKPNCKVLW